MSNKLDRQKLLDWLDRKCISLEDYDMLRHSEKSEVVEILCNKIKRGDFDIAKEKRKYMSWGWENENKLHQKLE